MTIRLAVILAVALVVVTASALVVVVALSAGAPAWHPATSQVTWPILP